MNNENDSKEKADEASDDIFSSMADGMGVDKQTMEALKPIIPKLILEFIRGVSKFAEEDKHIQEMMHDSIREKGGLLTQNIYSVRGLLVREKLSLAALAEPV